MTDTMLYMRKMLDKKQRNLSYHKNKPNRPIDECLSLVQAIRHYKTAVDALERNEPMRPAYTSSPDGDGTVDIICPVCGGHSYLHHALSHAFCWKCGQRMEL